MFLKEISTTITYQNMKPSVIFIIGKKSEIFNIFFPKIQDLFLSKFPLFSLKISSQLKFPPILTGRMAAFWIWGSLFGHLNMFDVLLSKTLPQMYRAGALISYLCGYVVLNLLQ